jgi:hypothetical protein
MRCQRGWVTSGTKTIGQRERGSSEDDAVNMARSVGSRLGNHVGCHVQVGGRHPPEHFVQHLADDSGWIAALGESAALRSQ